MEARARQEAVRLRELEQRQLEKQMSKKKAKEVAEMNFRERLDDFQRRDAEQETRDQEKLRINLERVERAGVRADAPIDDSAVVDDMFGFLEDQKDTVSESQAPSAFRYYYTHKDKPGYQKMFSHFLKNQAYLAVFSARLVNGVSEILSFCKNLAYFGL